MAPIDAAVASSWAMLAAIAAALVVLCFIALRLPRIAQVLVFAQVIYWTISYLGRPLVLLIVEPPAQFADTIADSRISAGGYGENLPAILGPIVFGLWTYAALVALYAWFASRRPGAEVDRRPFEPPIATFFIVYGLGIVARLAFVAGNQSNITSTLVYLATVGAVGLLVYYRGRTQFGTIVVLVGVIGIEVVWSALIASKTPILTVPLALALRISLTGWNRRRAFSLVGLALIGVLGFSGIQSIKTSDVVASDVSTSNAAYPAIIQPALPMLRRFDLMAAVTDAVFFGPGHWTSITQTVGKIASDFVPAPLQSSEKPSAGAIWASQIRAASIPNSNTDVSLAEGVIAEGYVFDGYPGILGENLYLVALLALVSDLLARGRVFGLTVGTILASYPVLFERGLLGGFEVLSKAIQIGFVVYLVWLLVAAIKANGRFGLGTKKTDRASHGPVARADLARDLTPVTAMPGIRSDE